MRGRALFIGFVVLNLAFAGAIVYFVTRSGGSSTPTPPATLSSRPGIAPTNLAPAAPTATNPVVVAAPPPQAPAAPQPPAPAPSAPLVSGREFGWQDIESTNYLGYLENLKKVGCPEPMTRQIVFHDANELFNQRRLQAAITNDFKWWQGENQFSAAGYNPEFQSRMQILVQERRELLTRLLGNHWEEEDKAPSLVNHTVALTGPVLGALPVDLYMAVQEICARSVSRHQDYLMGRFNDGQASSQVELAKLRDQTRKDLSVILDKNQLEEFLLRFSHNSSRLRQDMRGLGLAPEEFRKIFRATDPIDHQIQLEYGGEEALSVKQREQLMRQRDQAIQGVLGQERYARLILSRDPIYRQAQMLVLQSGAPDTATQELFEVLKSSQAKRVQIQSDSTLNLDQKQTALIQVNQEQLAAQKRLLQPAPSPK